MIRTDAPKDLGGKLWANLARTTPEFPVPSDMDGQKWPLDPFLFKAWLHTVRACNLSPNDPELGAPRFAGCAIDEGNLFAQIEARSGHQQERKPSAG